MIKGKQNIVEWLRMNNTPFWKLFNIQRTGLISESSEEDGLTTDGSIADFERKLDLLGSGQFALEAWETAGQKKERKKVNFEIGAPVADNIGLAGISGMPMQQPAVDVQSQIQKALDEYKQEVYIKELEAKVQSLEAENKALKLENDNAGVRIFNKIEPYIQDLLGKPQIKSAVSGQLTDEQQASVDREQQRLEKAFDKWMQNETQCVDIVEKIATLSDSNKETYNMARGILLNS